MPITYIALLVVYVRMCGNRRTTAPLRDISCVMEDAPTPLSLATAAIEAAFDLVTRYTTSSDVVCILEVNRLIRDLKTGDTRVLTRAIRALNTLGWTAEFADFRTSLHHLRSSLPAFCTSHVTGMEISSVGEGLKLLSGAATTLSAPDVASTIAGIAARVLMLDAQHGPTAGDRAIH